MQPGKKGKPEHQPATGEVAALKWEVRGQYEAAIAHGNVAVLSELTPLLRLLDMTKLGVGLYLQ